MNTRATLTRTSQLGGPFVLGAGTAMLTVALITSTGGTSPQAAPAPTVTPPPPPRPVTVAPSPQPRASATFVVQRPTVARSRPSPQMPDQPGTHANDDGGMAAEQAPSPPPANPPPTCAGRILAVQLPLGVLGDCLITLGGPPR